VIGLTATPSRGDGQGLGELFDDLIKVSSVRELQELGVLVPCVTYAPSSPTKDLSQDPVAAYLARAAGERTFVFASSIAHAELIAIAFAGECVPAATIHADTPWDLRSARIEAFRLQDRAPLLAIGVLEPAPLVLVNVYTLTEGVDVPEATTAILARGCGHPGMWLQIVGRVLRAAAGKTRAQVIDLRGAVHRCGLPEQDREWSLEGKATRELSAKRDPKLKLCPACGGVFSLHAVDRMGWRLCPICRERVAPPAPPSVVPRKLVALGGHVSPAQIDASLEALARSSARVNGNRAGWVRHRMIARHGFAPPWEAICRALALAGVSARGGDPS
jgi:superfamily II DNA or RNA helicase